MLQDDQVTVSNTLTKEEANAIADTPKLTVAVYAVQKACIDTPAEAWKTATAKAQ